MLMPLIGLVLLMGFGLLLLSLGLLLRYIRRVSGSDWPRVQSWLGAAAGIVLLMLLAGLLGGC